MPDEIISSWDNVNELVMELVQHGSTYERLADLQTYQEGPTQFRFRLEDASGARVTFPLRLISTTTFESGNG